MFLTGTKDTLVPPASVKAAYTRKPGSKVFANQLGVTHMEPINAPMGHGSWSPFVADFFDCHIGKKAHACDESYTSMQTELKLSEYEEQGKPAPATPTPPPAPS